MVTLTSEGNRLLKRAEVAELLSVPVRTVRRYEREGGLPYVELAGRTRRYVRADVEQFFQSRRKNTLAAG